MSTPCTPHVVRRAQRALCLVGVLASAAALFDCGNGATPASASTTARQAVGTVPMGMLARTSRAVVAIDARTERVVATATPDAQGRFTLANLPKGTTYRFELLIGPTSRPLLFPQAPSAPGITNLFRMSQRACAGGVQCDDGPVDLGRLTDDGVVIRPQDAQHTPLMYQDIDGDGRPDALDDDIDGDGVTNATDHDNDRDGVPDGQEYHDGDADGVSDSADEDDDNDGMADSVDADDDNDGTPDAMETDIDGDGVPNAMDDDIDGDGVPNAMDNDADGDGDLDARYRGDEDGDGVPDAMDDDSDGDGVPNTLDNDHDNDGIPDTTDTDDNNDGMPDVPMG